MTPAGNFFEPWDSPRLHPGRTTGSLPLENECFSGPPCTAEVLRIYNDSFLLDFRDFRSKRVSEQSQIQFYQSYWLQHDTAQFVSHTSQKNNLP